MPSPSFSPCFFSGLGIGSGVGSALAGKNLRASISLGWCQLLLTGAIAWTAYMLAKSLPYWPIDPSLTANAWVNFQLDLARCLWALLPATILWGASFPLALAAVAARGQDPGAARRRNLRGEHRWRNSRRRRLQHHFHSAGRHAAKPAAADRSGRPGRAFDVRCVRMEILESNLHSPPRFAVISILAALIVLPALLARSVAKVPGELIAYGREMATRLGESHILFAGEGMNSSVAVSQLWDGGIRNFHVSGKVEASSDPQDMRLAADARPHSRADSSAAALGADCRLRRGRDGRLIHGSSGRRENHPLRTGTARAENRRANISSRKITTC